VGAAKACRPMSLSRCIGTPLAWPMIEVGDGSLKLCLCRRADHSCRGVLGEDFTDSLRVLRECVGCCAAEVQCSETACANEQRNARRLCTPLPARRSTAKRGLRCVLNIRVAPAFA
jgi:hypothetical protein